jgi:hypothetical protein
MPSATAPEGFLFARPARSRRSRRTICCINRSRGGPDELVCRSCMVGRSGPSSSRALDRRRPRGNGYGLRTGREHDACRLRHGLYGLVEAPEYLGAPPDSPYEALAAPAPAVSVNASCQTVLLHESDLHRQHRLMILGFALARVTASVAQHACYAARMLHAVVLLAMKVAVNPEIGLR